MTRNAKKNIIGAVIFATIIGAGLFGVTHTRHPIIAELIIQNHTDEPVRFSVMVPDTSLVVWSIDIPREQMVVTADYPRSRSFPWDGEFRVEGLETGLTRGLLGSELYPARHFRPNDYTFVITKESLALVWQTGPMRR